MKRLFLLFLACLSALVACAQWTAKDSLNLRRVLGGKEQIQLNMDAVKQIDLSKPLGAPRASGAKPGLRVDETLPTVDARKKIVLTLHPYNSRTKYNWDPVYQRKIKIDASGVRQHILGERANGMMVTSFSMNPSDAIKLGKKGVTVNGGNIGGLDLMTVFTKDFWDKKGRSSRARTLDVLRAYGDSTTVWQR